MTEDSFEYPLCINGKKRALQQYPNDYDKAQLEKEALTHEEVLKWTEGKTVVKVIVVPKRMINIVVK